MVELWPSHIRKLMNQFSRAAPPAKEFETWARPRDLEKRQQAISTVPWSLWDCTLSWTFKDDIDAIRLYAESGNSRQLLGRMASDLFVKILKDATATPHTNPLAWWLVVLIQTEVLGDQPRWSVGGVQDTLSFYQKLEAIDRYARVLVSEDAFYDWFSMPGEQSRAQKQELENSMNRVYIGWIDQDAERPAVDLESHRQMASPEWRAYIQYIGPIFYRWLTDRTTGPLSTVIRLIPGKLESPSYTKVYKVMMVIEQNFSVAPEIADCYPAEMETKATIEEANKEAWRWIRTQVGPKTWSLKWDEVYDTSGMIRIRAVFRDHINDARVVAWVEEADSLIEDM